MPNIRPLSADLQRVATEKLNEVPEHIDDDINALRTWIRLQPHLNSRTDDQFLVTFLRSCKYNLEMAQSKLDKYYSLRTKYPELFTIQNVNDARVLEIVRCGANVFLPTPLHENGPRISFVRPGLYPSDEYALTDMLPVAATFRMLTLLEDDLAVVNGFVELADMSYLSAAHIFQMTPSLMKKLAVFGDEALPVRQKATYCVNAPAAFAAIFNTLKPMMPRKQQERMFIYGSNFDAIYTRIPQKYLPKEYGGANGSVKELAASMEQKFLEYREFLANDLQYGINESLRPGKPVDYDAIFGIEGSFGMLNVD